MRRYRSKHSGETFDKVLDTVLQKESKWDNMVPKTTTVNGRVLSGDIRVRYYDVKAVPEFRRVNRKVLRDEDVELVSGDIFRGLDDAHFNHLQETVETALARDDRRLNEHDARLDNHETRLDDHEGRLDDHENRVTQCETDIAYHEEEITALQDDLNDISSDLDNALADISNIEGDVEQLQRTVEALSEAGDGESTPVPGPPGAAAGFGAVTAAVDDGVGTPSVTVTVSGPDTAKNIKFEFHNLKGPAGDGSDIDLSEIEQKIDDLREQADKHIAVIEATLRADRWQGDSAPFTQQVSVEAEGGVIHAALGAGAGTDAIIAAAKALMNPTEKDAQSITITAYGEKPAVDIPITITIIN